MAGMYVRVLERAASEARLAFTTSSWLWVWVWVPVSHLEMAC